METEKKCLGQAYILQDQLVQDTITFITTGEGVNVKTEVVEGRDVIIEDIWEDLNAEDETHQYKKSGTKYFYWEYTQTNDEGNDIPMKFEAPQPKLTFFETDDIKVLKDNYDNGDYDQKEYPKYWAEKIIEANDNYNERYAIQKKEIVFAETKGPNYAYDKDDPESGESTLVHEKFTVKNNDLGMIDSILSTLYTTSFNPLF